MLPFRAALFAAAAAIGPTPTFVGVGAYAANSNVASLAPGYPAGLAANDILLLFVHWSDVLGDALVSSITGGWTLVDTLVVDVEMSASLYWKRATGSEAGTETVTFTEAVDGNGAAQAQIAAYRGCKTSGTPYEGLALHSLTSRPNHFGATTATTGQNRRVVAFFASTDVNTTGVTGYGWTEDWENGTAAGNTACMSGNSIEVAEAAFVPGCPRVNAATSRGLSFTLALIPTNDPGGGSPGEPAPLGSYSFDGSNDFIELSSTPVTAYPITVVAWMKPTAAALKAITAIGNSAATSRVQIQTQSAPNTTNAAAVPSSGSTGSAAAAGTYSVNVWQLVAGVFINATSRKAFRDGFTGTDATNVAITGLNSILMGARYSAGAKGAFFGGKLGGFAVYNMELTDIDLTALAAGYNPTDVQAANLVFYAPINEGVAEDIITSTALTVSGATADTVDGPEIAP